MSPPRLSPLSGAAALVLLPEIDPPIAPAEAAGAVEPGGGRVEVVAGADRRFLSGLRALGNAAVAWIEAERGGRH